MEWLLNLGYVGLFAGSFIAATVVPFSSDVLLLGMLAAGGNVWLCVLVATLGNWLGGLTSYWLGWLGKWEWIERYMGVKHETLVKHKSKIDRRIRDRSRFVQGGFQESGRPDADRQRSPLRLLGPAVHLGQTIFLTGRRTAIAATDPASGCRPHPA